jgi:hypothetical protein
MDCCFRGRSELVSWWRGEWGCGYGWVGDVGSGFGWSSSYFWVGRLCTRCWLRLMSRAAGGSKRNQHPYVCENE